MTPSREALPEKLEEALYEVVAAEIQRGEIRQGLWLKAMVESNSDDIRAKTHYAKLRVNQLMRDLAERAEAEAGDLAARQAALARLYCPYCKAHVGETASVCPQCNRILPQAL
jgi:hypothetical protein